jgi:hypothetical protein
MADLKNSRNTQLNTSTIRLVSNQKAVSVTAPNYIINYDSSGVLVTGQTLQITAVKLNTVAPVVWSTSNSNVKLYTSAAGTTEVTTDSGTTDTSVVYILASEFNAQELSSLKVTATVTDVDVVNGYVTFIKLQASPGSSTFTASLYLQNASYPTGTPPTAPVGGTFNFATGVLTAPTGTPQWAVTQPATSTTPTWACEYNFTGTFTQTVTAGTWQNVRIDTVTGSAGTRTAILDLYRWSSTVPTTFPSGTSTYTWATAQFVTKTGTIFTYNSWTTTPGTPVLGQTLYIARQVYADTGSSLTSDVAWSTTTALPIAVSGVNGTRTGVLEVYKWSSTQPTSLFPTGTSTYTWADGTFTLPVTPNGWSLLPGASVAGSTLWAVEATIADTGTSATSTVTWPSTQTAYAIGAAGIGGTSQNRVELYWQTATAPAVPTGTTYTFSTDNLTGTLGSWRRTPPTSTTTPTWVTSCLFTVVAPADSQTRSVWTTPVIYAQTGTNGTNGTKTWPVSAFLWATSVPTIPTLGVTFTWSNKSVSAYPAVTPATSPATYWKSSAPAAPGTGYTLYQITAIVGADAAADTTDFNWSSATLNSVGYRQDGTIGLTGDSARVAYVVTTSATVPGAVTAGSGDVVPTNSAGTWSFAAKSILDPGEYMYQVDGILSRSSGNITWGNPYLSNLKVGSLSAITANVGNLTVAEQGNIQTFGKSYGDAGGFFIGYDGSTNKFSIGDKLLYNGTTFSLPGITIGTNGSIGGIGNGNGTIVNNDSARPGGVNLVGNSGFLRNNGILPVNWYLYNNSSIAATSSVQTGGMFGQNYTRITAGATTPTTLGIYVGQSSSDSVKSWEPGQTYCISFWARGFAGALGKLMYGLYSNMGWAASSTNELENPVLTASWQRYVWRVIPANNANTALGELYISVVQQGTTTPLPSGSVIDICCPKVELGTQPSSWTPSPQDTMNINLEPSISAAQTTANAQSTTTLVGRNVTVNGKTLTKTGGSSNTWDADAYSVDSYVGGAYASVKVPTATALMFGLNSDPTTDSSYSSIDYALYLTASGGLQIYNSGTSIQTVGSYIAGDILAVTYDGVTVRYLKNGTVIGTPITANITNNLYFDSSFYTSGASLSNVQFGPLTSIGTVTATAASKLNKSAADTLTGPITVSTTGGIVAGNLTWDNTGTRTGGKGVAITPKGIVGHNGTTSTFVVDATTGDATFSGALSAATGNFTGAVYGGSYTNSYAWPAAGGTGFYLGSSGLLLGTANGTNPKYFQVTGEGNVYAPGFSIVAGTATFSGTLSGAIVNTDQIVGGAASVASIASSTEASVSVTVTVPPNASAVLLDYYLGPPTSTAYSTSIGTGKDTVISGSGYITGPILESLKDGSNNTTSIIVSPNSTTSGVQHTYTVTRSYYTGTMRLSVLILKR